MCIGQSSHGANPSVYPNTSSYFLWGNKTWWVCSIHVFEIEANWWGLQLLLNLGCKLKEVRSSGSFAGAAWQWNHLAADATCRLSLCTRPVKAGDGSALCGARCWAQAGVRLPSRFQSHSELAHKFLGNKSSQIYALPTVSQGRYDTLKGYRPVNANPRACPHLTQLLH